LYGTPAETDDELPREFLARGVGEAPAARAALLSARRGARVAIGVPQRGDKRPLLQTVARNPTETLARHKTRRAGDLSTRNRALEEIQEALGLPTAPLRIECYDISNLQGTEVVGSMVVFEDGLPRKSEYRRFVVRGTSARPGPAEGEADPVPGADGAGEEPAGRTTAERVTQNDVAAMHEVVTRRFRRLLEDRQLTAAAAARMPTDTDPARADAADAADETAGPMLVDPTTGAPRKFAYAPSLVVVDGGAPQVAAAQRALAELGIDDVALCGLAKRLEEVWLPDADDPVILPRSSEGLYLLQRIRDEAHRFAITHHRGRRSKSMVESVLDDVPGLGEVRRRTLLKHFGSLRKLRAAGLDEVAALPGFGERTALAVLAALSQQPEQAAYNATTGEVLDPGS